MDSIFFFSHFGTEGFSDTLKVTQLLGGRAGPGSQGVSLLVFVHLQDPTARGHCRAPTACPLPLHSLSGSQYGDEILNRMWVKFWFVAFQLCDPGQAASLVRASASLLDVTTPASETLRDNLTVCCA